MKKHKFINKGDRGFFFKFCTKQDVKKAVKDFYYISSENILTYKEVVLDKNGLKGKQ